MEVTERWQPRGSDRELSIGYDVQPGGEIRYAYIERDSAGRTVDAGYGLTLEACGQALDRFRESFPSARRTETIERRH